jgi:hypothetical protein
MDSRQQLSYSPGTGWGLGAGGWWGGTWGGWGWMALGFPPAHTTTTTPYSPPLLTLTNHPPPLTLTHSALTAY